MGKVYANGMEVCSGGSGGKSVAAMPDVCFTQPMAPPTPQGVPVPYPSTGMASDIQDGSTTVKIGGKPIALKDKSYFKKVSGDEAGNAGTKGLVSQTNGGRVYFASWSMNVKIEGLNVVRHLDLCTHNHGSVPGNTPPWPFTASMRPSGPGRDSECQLQPKKQKCPEGKSGHHVVPDHCFKQAGPGGSYFQGGVPWNEGLCICVKGAKKTTGDSGDEISRKSYKSDKGHYEALAEHGQIHKILDLLEDELGMRGSPPETATLGELERIGAAAVALVTGCDPEDLQDQLRYYHFNRKPPLHEDTRWRARAAGGKEIPVRGMGTDMTEGEGAMDD